MNPQKQTEQVETFKHDVRAFRDEVRLKLHLANMDLKDEWSKLEPQLERVLHEAAAVSGEVVGDLKKRIAEFKLRLKS